MLFSPAMRFGSNNCSPCKGSCVSAPPPCPVCPEDVLELAGRFPWRREFQCLTREELEDLLFWANQYRINHIGSPALSVIYAALHFLTIGEFHELERTSMLGIQGSVQTERERRSNAYGDGWKTSAWGMMYLDLLRHPINFIAVGA